MVSVKDRAKMFGNLASPGDAGKDQGIRQVGNKVSSSPFRSTASPSTKFSPSPFSKEKKQLFEGTKNMDWPDEDGIPAPGPMKRASGSIEQKLTPVTGNKFSDNSSPFKVLNNQKSQGKLPNFSSSKINFESSKINFEKRESASPLKSISAWEQRLKPKSLEKNENGNEASRVTATKDAKINAVTVDPAPAESSEPSQESSTLNEVESTNSTRDDDALVLEENNPKKPTRAERLQKARRVSSGPTASKSLKQSLQAANVVMQVEKSDAGASDASSRSSLSNRELSNIAKRALLSATASKYKRGFEAISPSNRLNMKASQALALKMSVGARGNNGIDIQTTLSTHSNDTSRSRRIDHPALAGRPVKTNISSAHMLASFHQFQTQRQNFVTKPKQVENKKKSFDSDFEKNQSDDDSMKSLEHDELPGESSMHSMSGRFGNSTHSRNGRKFSHMGKIHVAKNSCNDTVISSLSGNTQSLQSVPSRMMSPRNKGSQKTPLRLDPMPEDPLQAQRSALVRILSPGPSNRSGHSIANSIISASPRADYRSPSVAGPHDTSFMDTLEEKHSSSQESAGQSAELLDTALATAVEDMDIIDSPRTNPSAFSDGSHLRILSSSSHGRSNSPPGFEFKDTEESDHVSVPDENVQESSPSDTVFEYSTDEIEQEDKSESKEPVNFEPSRSTNRTVSTSLRSGMSSIQDGADVEFTKTEHEGSTSIRTGLSGIQRNSMEHSISIHTTVVNEDKEIIKAEQADVTQYPDTIEEENEVKSAKNSKSSLDDESDSFSGLKVKDTATTDGSSGTTTGRSTSLNEISSDPSDKRVFPGTNENLLPAIQTEENASEEVLSPGSKNSRLWKSGFGKSIGNAIKTALVKGSSSQSKNGDNDEGESLFEEDEDDIFGGLEVEQDGVAKSRSQRKQGLDETTPRLENLESNEKKEVSVSRRTKGSLSHRTNESFSRRANASLSRRTEKSRKSNASKSTRKAQTSGGLSSTPGKKPKTPSQKYKKIESPSAAPVGKANDRSGTIVDEQVVHNVNSDITSSLIGGPFTGQSPFHKAQEASKIIQLKEKEVIQEIPESKYSKEEMGGSFTKFMEESESSSVEQQASDVKSETILGQSKMEAQVSEDSEDADESQPIGSMFLNFGYGLVDSCNGFANLCAQGNKVDADVADETLVQSVACENKDSASVTSRSELTTMEKKVWNEWDRLNVGGVFGAKKPNAVEEEEKKDEETPNAIMDVAKAMMDVANAELNKVQKSEDECTKTTFSEGTESESETRFTKETDSGESGNSFGNSLTSGESVDSGDYTRGTYSSYSCSSADETDMMSEARSASVPRPMLLSFSQRSLMEKFSKQLTGVGVQVLKLNTRKQWQTRYFTVSMEQIALSAHEAVSKSGEIAQCPKALLWLKKFNPKSGGYGIVNIDKNGHGGMLLVDLVDIQVSERRDDMLENPIPKKLLDRFENSVLLTLKYKMKGILRSIEFRCGDNDEAQFLCTCMRVIRDLLRRERSLRQKLSKQAANKN